VHAENNDVITNKKTFSPKKGIKKRKINSAVSVPVIDEAVNLLRSIQSNKKEKDEYQLYGEQIAIKLRNITSPQARFAAQQIINKTLFEAETGILVNPYNSQPMFYQQTYSNMYSNLNYQPQPYQSPRYPPPLISPNSSSSFPVSQSSASSHSESTSDNLLGQNTYTENEYQQLLL